MNKKKLAVVLSVLVLGLTLSLTMFSEGKTRAAATCLVPSIAYLTIQDAANDVTCTEIDVAPGDRKSVV